MAMAYILQPDFSKRVVKKRSLFQQNINSKGTTHPSNLSIDENPVSCDEEIEEDRNCSEIQNHPLLNDVILRTVLDHVRPYDLLASRGVCKQWNVATIPHTRLAFQITIYENQTFFSSYGVPGLEYYTASELNAEQNVRKVQNFVELFSSNTLGIPFGKYKLGAFSTTDGVGQKFLGLCGDTMLEISFLDDIYKFEDVCEILKSTPKLQSLQVPTQLSSQLGNNGKLFPDGIPTLNHLEKIIYSAGPNNICPIYLKGILSVTKNIPIIQFNLDDGFSDNPDDIYKSLEVLGLIGKLGLTSWVQTLTLSSMTSEHVDILTSQSNTFKLKELTYISTGPEVDHIKLMTFFKNTLRDLSIWNMTTADSFMGFPKMPHLKRLFLKFQKKFNSRCVNLEKMFPSLEKLHLYGKAGVLHEEFFPESEPCLTVKSLQLVHFLLSLNGFKHIQIIFPNLVELHLSILWPETENVRHIWVHMTQLEVLTIEGDITAPINSVFTGISNQGIQEIRGTNVLNDLENMTEGVRRETIRNLKNQYSQLPSLTNLTKLRSVRLHVWGRQEPDHHDQNERHLTDLTLYFGLYCMENLKHVVVENCGFTETGCKILRDEMELETWSFKRGGSELVPLYTLQGSVRLANNLQAAVLKDII